ncbi:MAG: hypothetical protein FWE76_07355, partial [Symbiobacteriaceae bacterium]|nr:hypothetical protein [Symbiobacteriaceae bacterium]
MFKQQADLILFNGLIWTGDATNPQAEALAAKGGLILAVGSSSEITATYDAPVTRDLQQQRLL